MSKQEAAAFVIKLSERPDLAVKFVNDPDGVMACEPLSDEDKEVLKSGDDERIRKHLGDSGPPGCMVLVKPHPPTHDA